MLPLPGRGGDYVLFSRTFGFLRKPRTPLPASCELPGERPPPVPIQRAFSPNRACFHEKPSPSPNMNEPSAMSREPSMCRASRLPSSGEVTRYFPVNHPGLMELLQILLAISSLDSLSRHRVEGYGHVMFPRQPGAHEVFVRTWRPICSLRSHLQARWSFEIPASGSHRLFCAPPHSKALPCIPDFRVPLPDPFTGSLDFLHACRRPLSCSMYSCCPRKVPAC